MVLCLCHSVFASRDGITLTKQLDQNRSWVATAKSWGRWGAQALVSRAFGRSLMTGVPISMAVQAIIGFSESNTAAVEVRASPPPLAAFTAWRGWSCAERTSEGARERESDTCEQWRYMRRRGAH